MSVTQNQRRVVVDEIKQAMTIQVDPVDTLTSIYVDREEGIYAPVRVLPPGNDFLARSNISRERGLLAAYSKTRRSNDICTFGLTILSP